MLLAKFKSPKIFFRNTQKSHLNFIPLRNIQVSIIGSVGEVGSNLALLLKQNPKISRLQLYDDNESVNKLAIELDCLPGGPTVSAFAGPSMLRPAIRFTDLILMVDRSHRKPGIKREQMIFANAPPVQKLCRAMAEQNSTAFLAITTSPLNSIVPFASVLLLNYGSYNPFKVFGITHLDLARTRSLAGNVLQANPTEIQIPVIGGHSDETIVPLFSNISPNTYEVTERQADMLTRLIRKAGVEVVNKKYGVESATLSMAWSINEFVNCILDALRGAEVTVNSYTANPHFGTKFFSGPTVVGAQGLVQPCYEFKLNDFEDKLLEKALPMISRDVSQGEQYVDVFESFVRKF
ncbi:Malate dehydrogenase, mitochondrial [Papilio xuthus]|uniref:Malate dehydrogenase, mitochondrial n=1 Tax=Papilio xuthus TaxID=66420 RepID=A0A194Q8Z5_PAPXU|nr:Malate dehydrogenase, mitochondrial [Papilio xuthus]